MRWSWVRKGASSGMGETASSSVQMSLPSDCLSRGPGGCLRATYIGDFVPSRSPTKLCHACASSLSASYIVSGSPCEQIDTVCEGLHLEKNVGLASRELHRTPSLGTGEFVG